MSDDELKKMLQDAGFHNTHSPYEAAGTLGNFRELVRLANKRSAYPENCPKCAANFVGDPIPEEHRHFYGHETHFSRVIGVYDVTLDRTMRWRCPDCGHEWIRE